MATRKQIEAAKRNIKKAQEKWKHMSKEQRKRARDRKEKRKYR